MSRRFLLVLAAMVVVFGGLLVFNKKKDAATSPASSGDNQAKLSQHIQQGDSGVKLVEYGDFQCPGCGAIFPVFKQLKEKYAGKVTFQYRNFPLVEIHQFALLAARSAEAAAAQGKFWEMHDMLFENQRTWSNSSNPNALFEGYAKQIGLDVEKFKIDAKSEQINDIVMADKAEAARKGFSGTPSFELDGKQIKAGSFDEFVKLIDEALRQKQRQ